MKRLAFTAIGLLLCACGGSDFGLANGVNQTDASSPTLGNGGNGSDTCNGTGPKDNYGRCLPAIDAGRPVPPPANVDSGMAFGEGGSKGLDAGRADLPDGLAPTPDAGSDTGVGTDTGTSADTGAVDGGTGLDGSALDSETDSAVGSDAATCTAPTCVLTQGYWKNYPANWTVLPVVMGGVSYTEAACLALLSDPSVGDASVILAKQLIAAIENHGACDPTIEQTVSVAQAWMLANKGSNAALPYGVQLPAFGCDGSNMNLPSCQGWELGQELDAYNSGKGATPACQ